jgi:hypothetical protein
MRPIYVGLILLAEFPLASFLALYSYGRFVKRMKGVRVSKCAPERCSSCIPAGGFAQLRAERRHGTVRVALVAEHKIKRVPQTTSSRFAWSPSSTKENAFGFCRRALRVGLTV